MLFRFLLLFLALLITGCGSKNPSSKVIDYGVYDAVILTSGKWKLGIPVTIASVIDLKHQQTVTRVPAEDGRYWGFRARLTNPLKDRSVVCHYIIDHPEFTAPDGTKSSKESQDFEIPPGDIVTQNFLWYFVEGCEHEFVPGTWSFHISLDEREVFKKDFEIYKP